MLVKAVTACSGIIGKQANSIGNYKGVDIATCKDESTVYLLQIKDNYYYMVGYSDVDRIHAIIDGLNDTLENTLLASFNAQIENKSGFCSKGLAQFFNRVSDYEKVQQYREELAMARQQKQQEQERQQKEQQEHEYNTKLDQAKKSFVNNERITNDMFIELCKRNNIDLPIKTHGWCSKSLINIGVETDGDCVYRYYGRQSTVVHNIAKDLYKCLSVRLAKEAV